MSKLKIIKFILISFIGLLSISSITAQSMHDSWMRGQTSWRMDMGVSFGPTSGLQFQYFTPRRSTCKTLNKRIGFDFGVYYEGLLFGNILEKQTPKWQYGGIKGNISLIYFPDFRIKSNRFFFGGGIESGTRKMDNLSSLQTDIIAKLGWELSFLSSTGIPLVVRISVKYDKGVNSNFTYLLPTLGIIYGK